MGKHKERVLVVRMHGSYYIRNCMNDDLVKEDPSTWNSFKARSMKEFGVDNVREAVITVKEGWMESLFKAPEVKGSTDKVPVGSEVGSCGDCPLKVTSMGGHYCFHPSLARDSGRLVTRGTITSTPNWCPLGDTPVVISRRK